MVMMLHCPSLPSHRLSVLALSSRFDGRRGDPARDWAVHLSVLALSSRFDGRKASRVTGTQATLSVLALSSRFDGLELDTGCPRRMRTFSTRSVESF